MSELLNSGFFFSFFYFKISELSNSEILFSLNVPPTHYRSSITFFWIKLQSQTTSNVTTKNLLLYSYCPLYPQFNVAEWRKIQSLAASVVHISTLNEGRRGLQNRYICFSHNYGFKKQKTFIYDISRMWILILLTLLILNFNFKFRQVTTVCRKPCAKIQMILSLK